MALSSKPLRIILVDDDADLRNLLVSVLQRDGHEIVEAADGEEVLAMFETPRRAEAVADLIVTDVWMPRCSGLTMLEELRDRGVATPAIVLTAHIDIETQTRAASVSAAALLAKPFNTTDLRQHVRSLATAVDEKAAAASESMRAPRPA